MVDVSPTAGMLGPGIDASRDPHRIFLDACRENGVRPDTIRGPRRDKWIVTIRRSIAELLFNTGLLSYSEIGRMLGGRHHTTIMSLLNPEMNARRKARK
jgi:chromosomal replication initiation ATPase DnaA